MKLNFNEESVRNTALRQMADLMKKASDLIATGNEESKKFYSSGAHHFLQKHGWEILIPISKEEWPDIFIDLEYDAQMLWPYMTAYSYAMNVLSPPSVPWATLTFGYAVLEGKLVKTTFFTHQKLVPYQDMPQGIVIDPMAVQQGIQPDYYIGCPVCSKDYIEKLIIMRQSPFEAYVSKEGHLMR